MVRAVVSLVAILAIAAPAFAAPAPDAAVHSGDTLETSESFYGPEYVSTPAGIKKVDRLLELYAPTYKPHNDMIGLWADTSRNDTDEGHKFKPVFDIGNRFPVYEELIDCQTTLERMNYPARVEPIVHEQLSYLKDINFLELRHGRKVHVPERISCCWKAGISLMAQKEIPPGGFRISGDTVALMVFNSIEHCKRGEWLRARIFDPTRTMTVEVHGADC
ncbi:hypothetical protein QBC35DRAFT_453981 [Podospora australis]|uniref:Secreted protein n=1 Tax=Podospora australis TaxID=1536484 RepID=A0AAN6WQT7_9PEZI|nr:hypothetical protein QBC35DRAFT_453981 [Podospora australis]